VNDQAGPSKDRGASDEADIELVEREGVWTLRIASDAIDLLQLSSVRVLIRPNLVPGHVFTARVSVTQPIDRRPTG
jgi:hypothetical protein